MMEKSSIIILCSNNVKTIFLENLIGIFNCLRILQYINLRGQLGFPGEYFFIYHWKPLI